MIATAGTHSCYRTRQEAKLAWTINAAAARPGEVWTYRYTTAGTLTAVPFTTYTAGPVRIPGEEIPFPALRDKCLGEVGLDGPAAWLQHARRHSLHRGDQAPVIPFPGRTGLTLTDPGAAMTALLEAPRWQHVLVEHHRAHPAYAGLRFVEAGHAGAVKDFGDGQGPGRYVGPTWVRLVDVTAIVVGVTR